MWGARTDDMEQKVLAELKSRTLQLNPQATVHFIHEEMLLLLSLIVPIPFVHACHVFPVDMKCPMGRGNETEV